MKCTLIPAENGHWFLLCIATPVTSSQKSVPYFIYYRKSVYRGLLRHIATPEKAHHGVGRCL
jgi:hypothetical protein